MVSKTLGYILAGVGLLGTALLFEPVKQFVKLSTILPAKWNPTDTTLTIISIGAFVAGIVILYMNRQPAQPQEVPIYHGKQVVGFRRMKK